MAFLDRFKPQPKWKHADPAVRAASIAEMPRDAEHVAVVEELASSDDDLRVRRAAVERLDDVEVLVRLARTERDMDLRRQITERLVGIALEPASDDAAAARALEGIEDQKQCSTIAKMSPYETVRTAALARVHDVRALGSIARNASDAQTALEAVGRIADASELLNVALKTEHRDAGVAALERAVEATATSAAQDAPEVRETLTNVATRAKSKAVVKRAKNMLQAIEEAEAARRAALEQWQQRMAAVLARVEALAAAPSLPDAASQLTLAESEWRQIAAEGSVEPDTDTVARFGTLVETARTGIEAHERAQAERRAKDQRLVARRDARTAIVARVDGLRGEDALAEVEAARAEWTEIETEEGELDLPALTARFEEAAGRVHERHANRQEIERSSARLAEIAAEAGRLTSAEALDEPAWQTLRQEWQTLSARVDTVDAEVAAQFAEAEGRVRQRDDERRLAAERVLKQQMQKVEQLLERAAARTAAEDLTLREADRIVRDLRAAVDNPPSMPERELRPLIERLHAAQTALAPRLHELREMDEWKRFANAAVQEELIARTEGLRAKYGFDSEAGPKAEDLDKAARELHEIQERWKQAAEAPRAQAQALWHRYRQAADPIQTKVRELFVLRSAERQGNLERKLALIERAEALSESTDWVKTAEELKRLQAEWQGIGPVPRQDTRVTWKRFREACDKFFTRRTADLSERKEVWSANLAKKEALIARAEELSTSTEWEKAAAEIRRLQAEWKASGPVRRNKSEVVWQRFRAACDTFFDRYKRRDQIELEAKQADREGLVTELEALGPVLIDEPALMADEGGIELAPQPPAPVEGAVLLEAVRSLRSRWNQTAPAVRQGADPLSARFMNALERLIAAYPDAFRGTELDGEANRQKMEKLCERVEGFLKESAAAPPSSSQALAAMLREALASNTIGGRAGEESKWRAMSEEVRQAQASWSRLGPVPGEAGRQLAERFHRATSRFFDQYRRRVPQQDAPPAKRKPVGAR